MALLLGSPGLDAADAGFDPQVAAPLATVDELVEIGAGGELITKREVHVKVRVVGAGPYRPETSAAFWARIGGMTADWQLLFHGRGVDLDARSHVFEGTVGAHTPLDLAARVRDPAGWWQSIRWTLEESNAVACYRSGDRMPAMVGGSPPPDRPDYLAQFVESEGEVTLGPGELLYSFELEATDPCEPAFDRQDLAVVVTLEAVRPPAAGVARAEKPEVPARGEVAARGKLGGFSRNEEYFDFPPITVSLANLPPGSLTYLRCYPGPPCTNPEEGRHTLVPGSGVLIHGDTPQDRSFVLRELAAQLCAAYNTLEVVHSNGGTTEVLFRVGISIEMERYGIRDGQLTLGGGYTFR